MLVGVAVPASIMGYQDTIGMLFGYDPEQQRLTGFAVLQSRETPGLGSKIGTDPAFLASLNDLDVTLEDAKLKTRVALAGRSAERRPHEVDGVTGATVSIAIGGPEIATLTSGPSDASGIAEATWSTSAPNRKGNGGTATGTGGTLVVNEPVTFPEPLVLSGTLVVNDRFDLPQLDVRAGGVVTHDRGLWSMDLRVAGTLRVADGDRIVTTTIDAREKRCGAPPVGQPPKCDPLQQDVEDRRRKDEIGEVHLSSGVSDGDYCPRAYPRLA